MPSPELIDERFDDIVRELRGLPGAPEGLRERVGALAAREPQPPRPLVPRLRLLHVAYGLAGVAVALVGLSAASGLLDSGVAAREEAAVGTSGAAAGGGAEHGAVKRAQPAFTLAQGAPPPAPPPIAVGGSALTTATADARAPVTLPPGRRLTRYTATMKLRVSDVDELSDTTQEAMRVARRLGGFVASVRYGTPQGDEGDAFLTLRVPTSKVQQAIVGLSQLGTIVSQRISITDVQERVNRQDVEIARLRRYVAKLQQQLRGPLSEERRLELELELDRAQASLRAQTQRRAATVRSARLATVSLALTTREAKAVPKPDNPGRIERSAENAIDALSKEVAVVLYLLIALSPLAVLLALAAVGSRVYRRRYAERLLEHA